MELVVTDAVAVLERTPSVLRALLAGLPEAWTHADEGPDTWSPFDVVGHLIDAEETNWMPRARIILEQDPAKRFEPFDRFRHLALNRARPLTELLERFDALRSESLRALSDLAPGPEALRLAAEHPELGRVTLAQLLATWVAHDLGHLAQVARVMAKQYGRAVGPWQAYLPVLRR